MLCASSSSSIPIPSPPSLPPSPPPLSSPLSSPHTRLPRVPSSSSSTTTQVVKDFVAPFGDRRQEIVIIGVSMDEPAITSRLDWALVTDAEMALYTTKANAHDAAKHAASIFGD